MLFWGFQPTFNRVFTGICTKYHVWTSSNDKTIRVWTCDADFRYMSEGAIIYDGADAAELNKSLQEQLEALQARLNDIEAEHRVEKMELQV